MSPASILDRVVKLLRQVPSALVKNTSIFVKITCAFVLFGYFLSFIDNSIDILSVTPGYLIPPNFWIWTVVTHWIFEIRFWQVCVTLLAIALSGKLIEPLWGAYEMFFFLLLVNISIGLLSSLFYVIVYMATENPEYLFKVHIHGMTGYIAGLSVAVLQIMPDQVMFHTKTPLGKVCNRHLPLILLLISIMLYFLGAVHGQYLTMVCCGISVSWVYLRFYQVHSNGSRGDMSENFKFSR